MSKREELFDELWTLNGFDAFWNEEATTPEDMFVKWDECYKNNKAFICARATDKDQSDRYNHGHSFEYIYRKVCDLRGIEYTSHSKSPRGIYERDFIHPNFQCELDGAFPRAWLTIAETKISVRDRWREVIDLVRIDGKVYLFTLDKNKKKKPVEEYRDLHWVNTEETIGSFSDELRKTGRLSTINRYFERLFEIQKLYEKWRFERR